MSAGMDNDGVSRVTAILGLAAKCPFDQTNPVECPLYALRKRSMRERYAWVRAQSPATLEALYQHHRNCLARKEQGCFAWVAAERARLEAELKTEQGDV